MEYFVYLYFWDSEGKKTVFSTQFKFDNLMDAATFAQQASDNYFAIGRMDVSVSWHVKR